MTALVIGLVVGGVLIGVPAARYQRTVRARADWVGLRKAHRTARQTFWRELGGLIGAALLPILAVAVILFALYLIGRPEQ